MRSQETPSSVDFFPKTDARDALSDRHTWRSKGVQHTSCLVAREEEGTMIVLISEGQVYLVLREPRGRGAKGGRSWASCLPTSERQIGSSKVVCQEIEVWRSNGPRNRDGGRMEAIAPIGIRP